MRVLFFVLLAFGANTVYAQYFFKSKGGKWGLKNDYGKTLVLPMFDDIRSGKFSEGFASVSINGRWGFINETGRQAVPYEYDSCYDFSEGLAVVYSRIKPDDRFSQECCGYVDGSGKMVIPAKYYRCSSFTNGIALVKVWVGYKNYECYFINKKGGIVAGPFPDALPFREGRAAVMVQNNVKGHPWRGFYLYTFIDENKKQITQPIYIDARSFSHGMARVETDDGWSYIDLTGKPKCRVSFEECGDFNHLGLAKVKHNGKWGYVNKDCLFIIWAKYDDLGDFREGGEAVAARLDGKYGFVSKDGKEITPFKYLFCMDFYEGFGIVVSKTGFGLVDINGKEVIPCRYELCGPLSFEKKVAMVQLKSKKYRFFSLDSGEEFGPLADEILEINHDELFGIEANGKFSIFNVKLQKEVTEHQYDDIAPFTEQMAAVKRNGLWGYIDHSGKEVIPPTYDEAYLFEDGKTWVVKGGQGFYINKAGEEIGR